MGYTLGLYRGGVFDHGVGECTRVVFLKKTSMQGLESNACPYVCALAFGRTDARNDRKTKPLSVLEGHIIEVSTGRDKQPTLLGVWYRLRLTIY